MIGCGVVVNKERFLSIDVLCFNEDEVDAGNVIAVIPPCNTGFKVRHWQSGFLRYQAWFLYFLKHPFYWK